MKIKERYETVLRIYDNKKTFDRFTVIPPRWAHKYRENDRRLFLAIGASENPFHPQGFGQTVSAMPGPHLGKRIKWSDLPEAVKRFAEQTFPEFCEIEKVNQGQKL